MREEVSKYIAVISYIVEKLHEIDKEKQIGKTFIQKLLYILNTKKIVNIHYELYHYGPYSFYVNSILNISETLDVVSITWKDDNGYFIKPSNKKDIFKNKLNSSERRKINTIIKNVKDLNAKELSILTTANYILNKFPTKEEELLNILHSVKKDIPIEEIKYTYKNYYSKLF